MAVKGKQIAEKTPPSSTKRKAETPTEDISASTSTKKRNKNPGVLQFFDVAAECSEEDDGDNSSDSDDDDDDDFDLESMDEDKTGKKGKGSFGKTHNLPFLPKEEELSDEELEILLKERYKPGSRYVVYADDDQAKNAAESGEMDPHMDPIGDPNLWRVKCTVGRERLAAFCLIQKFVDFTSLGNKLKIASAFAPDHIKGYIYIEAEKEIDVLEACKSLSIVYSSRISRVPKNEISHLFVVRSTSIELPPGTWVRVKHGKYRGDLAQVVAFDESRKSATVKLIPRIDLQALSKKLAGGGAVKQTVIPAARVISSKDLKEFQSHIVLTRDRQTGKVFQTLDGLKLKDGFLYKKASLESITYVDVKPSADEFLKFKHYKKDESDDSEWLSHLYGEQKKKRLSEDSKEIGKGSEGTSGTKKGNDFQLHDLVFYGPKEFGVIIGVENDSFQILKYDEVEGAEVLNVELHEMTNSGFEKKFTTMDQHMKVISLKDTVRVLEGPFMGRQGVVKHICKGTIFIYNADQLENGGYICAKSKSCESISRSDDANDEKFDNVFGQGDAFGAQGFEDSTSSPTPQQFPKKPWQDNESTLKFNTRRQGDRDGGFSVGQTLRIRVGPLKGHLCRVVSIYRSDVTVKVDSQAKVFSVKADHLSVAGVKSNFMKQSDGFASQGELSGAPTESDGWGSVPLMTGSSWADLSSTGILPDSSWKNPLDSVADNGLVSGTDDGDDAWGVKTTKKAASSWGNAAGFGEEPGKEGEGAGDDPWGSNATCSKATDSWGNAGGGDLQQGGDDPWGVKASTTIQATDSWGTAIGIGELKQGEGDDPWGISVATSKATGGWGSAGGLDGGEDDPWGNKATNSQEATNSWGNATGSVDRKGDGTCYNCNGTGHMARDCTQPRKSGDRSGGKGDVTCYNCNETGHMSKDCTQPRKSGDRGGGRGDVTCYNCNETGHMSKDCTQPRKSGDRGGRGDVTCYNCNETGHMSKDCMQPRKSGDRSGGNGDVTCYNCNETGHMSRDCTQPRRSGDRGGGKGDVTCYNCNETGHMSRDCTQPRKSGDRSGGKGDMTCFNCNEPGHMSRDCTQPRNSGGRPDGTTCYKCNGVGHIARNCQNQGSGDLQQGGEDDSWGNKPTGSWGTTISSGDLKKDGGDDPWGSTKQTSDGWGTSLVGGDLKKDGGDDSWGSKAKTKQTADSWGISTVGGDLKKDEGEDPWGSKASTSQQTSGGWGNANEFLEKAKNEGAADAGGSKGWGSGALEGQKSSGWGNKNDWSTPKDSDAGEPKSSGWVSSNNFNTPKGSGADQGSGWDNSPNDNGGNMTQGDGWDNKVSSWKNGAADADGKKSSCWGNASEWTTPKDSNAGTNKSCSWGNGSSWGTSNAAGGNTSGWGGGSDNNVSESSHHSNRARAFGRGGSLGSNRGGFGNGGRGNGDGESSGFSSRGRGFRGRGRGDSEQSDFSNRGRGFGRGGSPGSDRGGFGGNRGRGRRDQAGDWNSGSSSRNNQNSWSGSANDGAGGWGKGSNSSGWGSKGATDDAGGQVSGWGNTASGNKGNSNDGGWGSKGATDDAGGQVSGWGNQASGDKRKSKDGGWGNKGATDDAGGQVSGWGNQTSGDKRKSNDGGWGGSSGWGSKGATDDAGVQVSGWGNQASGDKGKSNDGGWGGDKQTDSWNMANTTDGNESGGWNKSAGSQEETAGSSTANDTWGKAAAESSWGTDKGGSSGKGGW